MNEERLGQNGSPKPVKKVPPWLDRLATVVVVVGGLVVVPVLCVRSGAFGATRSARLQWERRQTLIQEALLDQTAQPEPALEKAP